MKYRVLCTEHGLNFNDEYITEEAIATFPIAFPDGQAAHFFHPNESLPYPPVIGKTVGMPEVSPTQAYSIIDYDEGFARNFESDNTYDISVYSFCTSHIDADKWIRVIDEFLYHPDNSIDVVPYGAVPAAKVLGKVEDGVTTEPKKDFVRCQIKAVPQPCDEPREGKEEVMTEQQIKDAITAAIADSKVAVADEDVTRIADSVAAAVSAVTVEPAAKEQEVDIQQVVADSLKAGAESGLTGKSIERVSNAVLKGDSIADAIANEKALIDEFKEQFKTETVENSVHRYGSESTTAGGTAADIVSRIFAKKGV